MSAEIDTLEQLNNADLRAKCKEYGLPNVPVTDSSRKVLIKKLRASIGGGASPLPASPATKKAAGGRRDTIGTPSKPFSSVAENEKEKPHVDTREADKEDKYKVRRTIAAVTSSQPVKPVAAEKPAPIKERRRSVAKSRDAEIIGKDLHKPQQKPTQPTFDEREETDVMEEILIEDDEDDFEHQLLAAAERAEAHTRTQKSDKVRGLSLSKTNMVSTTTVTAAPRTEQPAIARRTSQDVQNSYMDTLNEQRSNVSSSLNRDRYEGLSTLTQTTTRRELPTMQSSTTSRYSTNFSSTQPSLNPTKSYNSPLNYNRRTTLAATSSLRDENFGYGSASKSTTKAYYNEQSDDTEDLGEDLPSTPYLSNFARNLERIKAEPLARTTPSSLFGGDSELARRKRASGKLYESRPHLHRTGAVNNWSQMWQTLNRKYHLKFCIFLLCVVLLLTMLFVLFWQ